MRILVVEDDNELREGIAAALRGEGHNGSIISFGSAG